MIEREAEEMATTQGEHCLTFRGRRPRRLGGVALGVLGETGGGTFSGDM